MALRKLAESNARIRLSRLQQCLKDCRNRPNTIGQPDREVRLGFPEEKPAVFSRNIFRLQHLQRSYCFGRMTCAK